MALNEQGYEIPDNTPVAMPSRLRVPQSRADQMRQFIRQEMSLAAQAQGQESFEEANDLEVEDDDMPRTAYEQAAEWGQSDEAAMVEQLQRVREAAKTPPPAQDPPSPSAKGGAGE